MTDYLYLISNHYTLSCWCVGAETCINEESHIGLHVEVLVPIAELLRDRDFEK